MPDALEGDPYAFDRVLDAPIASLSNLPAVARYGLALCSSPSRPGFR